MKRLIRPAAILILLILALPAAADKAKSLYNKGKDAEARQNYEEAYENYKQAFDLKPKDLAYRAAYDRIRFLAGASHVHRGQLLRDAGKLQEALAEYLVRARKSEKPARKGEVSETYRALKKAGLIGCVTGMGGVSATKEVVRERVLQSLARKR